MNVRKSGGGRWMLIAVAFAGSCAHLAAADYYVAANDANANDSNPGTQSSPWKTISKANQAALAGDTIYIKQGTYGSFIAPARSGTPANYITYRNYGNDYVLISENTRAIQLINKSYIAVQ